MAWGNKKGGGDNKSKSLRDGLISILKLCLFHEHCTLVAVDTSLEFKGCAEYAREFTVNCTALILDCFVSAKRIQLKQQYNLGSVFREIQVNSKNHTTDSE